MHHTPIIVTAILLATPTVAGGLSYADRSNGLETPRMDGGSTEFEFSDVNGDGHVDIISIGDHGSPFVNTQEHGIMVWFGDGTGNWSVMQNGTFGYGGCALGDVNNDGFMDIAYGMHHDYSSNDFGNQLLEVSLGDGSGTNWTPWDDGLATNGETWGMFGSDFADVDNDGDLDVGSISFGCCAGLHVYLNNGDGTWTQSFGVLGGNSGMEFQFGDVNGDGLADFVASYGPGTVYLGDGAGGFVLDDGNLPFGPWRFGVSLGDVNGDGRDDLAFHTNGGVQVWTWQSPGSWQSLTGSLSSIGGPGHTQIADMNLDGFGDVVANASNNIRVYTGDGAGTWTLASDIFGPAECGRIALRAGTDADHNGFPDLVYVSEEACDPFQGGTNRPRFYAETSIPIDSFIFPKSPRGGEILMAGSVRFIDWNAAVPTTEGNPAVSIEVSTTGPNGPWTTIADHVPNNGRYQWLIPVNTPSTQSAALRLTLHTEIPATEITPGAFTIIGSDPARANLTTLDIVTGTLLDGSVDDLRQSNNSYVHTRSGFGVTLIDLHHMEARIDALTTIQSAATLDLSIEARTSEPSGIAQVRLLNHNTGQFDMLDQYAIGMTDQVHAINNIDASNYVTAQGDIQLATRHVVFVPFLAFTFESWIDWVEIGVR